MLMPEPAIPTSSLSLVVIFLYFIREVYKGQNNAKERGTSLEEGEGLINTD